MTTRMIFLRHGESESNVSGYFTGHMNVPLTERGRAQAACAARALRDMPIDRAYASDLVRAMETGTIAAVPHGLVPAACEGLREIDGGRWEGVPFSELETRFPEDYRVWREDLANARCTGGESIRELVARVQSACLEIARREAGHTVLIATHATPIRAMQLLWQGLTADEIEQISWVPNASVSIADFDGARWTPVSVGDTAHLRGLETRLPTSI